MAKHTIDIIEGVKNMIINILVLILLISVNGILSASELAFLSLEKFELDKMVRKRKKNDDTRGKSFISWLSDLLSHCESGGEEYSPSPFTWWTWLDT